jgi:hypothetical protein
MKDVVLERPSRRVGLLLFVDVFEYAKLMIALEDWFELACRGPD